MNQRHSIAAACLAICLLVSLVIVRRLGSDEPKVAGSQREAIIALRKVGGVFEFHPTGAARNLTFTTNRVVDEDLIYLTQLGTLKSLDFNASNRVTNRGFQFIRSLPHLRLLNLGGTAITDDGLAVVSSLEKLETLHLWLTNITDRGLQHIATGQKLQTLNLWDAEISDEGLAHLAKIPSLRRLYIGRSQGADLPLPLGQPPGVTAAGVAKLQAALPKTKIYHWSREPNTAAPDSVDATETTVRVPYSPEPVKDISARRGHDWPSFLGPSHDGKAPAASENPFTWGEQGPTVLWQREIGDSHSAPAIHKGRLFFFDRMKDSVRLVCLHAESGKFIWEFRAPTAYEDQVGYGNGPRSSPVVDGDRVYAYGADGMLYCVMASSGKRVWRVDTMKKFGVIPYFFGVGSTPVVEDNLLLVVVGGSPPQEEGKGVNLAKLKGNGTGVVAFDKFTGEVRYRTGDTLSSYAAPRIVSRGGRRWAFVYARGELLGFHPATGKIDFQYPWKARFPAAVSAATPVVVEDQVFISECYGPGASMLRFAPGKYEVVWRDERATREKAMQTHWNTPIHDNGSLYGCSGRHASEGDIRCLDWQTGKVLWSHHINSRGSLLQIGRQFICLDEYGGLRLFRADPTTYAEVANIELKEDPDHPDSGPLLKYPCWTAPVFARGLLYVRGKDRLVCLAAEQ